MSDGNNIGVIIFVGRADRRYQGLFKILLVVPGFSGRQGGVGAGEGYEEGGGGGRRRRRSRRSGQRVNGGEGRAGGGGVVIGVGEEEEK